MEPQWDDRLLSASWSRARSWTADNPIKYSVIFGAPALILQVAITAGFLRMGGVLQALLSLFLVPVAIIGFMIMRTWLLMLYEVRDELGRHLDPEGEEADPENFTCELTDVTRNEIAVRVINHDQPGEFQVKVVDLEGVERKPVPITLRWQAEPTESVRRINRDDSDIVSVVRVRGRRAIDFLEPAADGKDRYQRVATACDSTNGRPDEIGVVLRIFNRQAGGDGRRSHVLRLRFDNGGDTPTPLLEPLVQT